MSPESLVPARRPRHLRVLVMNHHSEVQDAITHLLSGFEELVVVGQARNGASALAIAAQVFADVVLVDLDLEPNRGAVIAVQIRGLLPQVHILLTSQVDCDLRVDQASPQYVDRLVKVGDLNATLPALIARWRDASGDRGSP